MDALYAVYIVGGCAALLVLSWVVLGLWRRIRGPEPMEWDPRDYTGKVDRWTR